MGKIQEEFLGYVHTDDRRTLTEDKGTEFQRSLEKVIGEATKSTDRALRLCEDFLGRGGANEYTPYDRLLEAHSLLEQATRAIGSSASELPDFAERSQSLPPLTGRRRDSRRESQGKVYFGCIDGVGSQSQAEQQLRGSEHLVSLDSWEGFGGCGNFVLSSDLAKRLERDGYLEFLLKTGRRISFEI